jgi:hypothetical protein
MYTLADRSYPFTLPFLESPVPPPKKELLFYAPLRKTVPSPLFFAVILWLGEKNRLPSGKIPVAAGKNPVENWERMFNLQ